MSEYVNIGKKRYPVLSTKQKKQCNVKKRIETPGPSAIFAFWGIGSDNYITRSALISGQSISRVIKGFNVRLEGEINIRANWE